MEITNKNIFRKKANEKFGFTEKVDVEFFFTTRGSNGKGSRVYK